MLTLHIHNNDNTVVYDITDQFLVKRVVVDENLTTNLESSSSLWRVTLTHDFPYSLDIIQQDDLRAELVDGNTTFFTGWVSTTFNYIIDQYGQNAVQITLEDNGTHLLKTPYTKNESVVISGKFSSLVTGDLGVVQQICAKCGITYDTSMVTDNTDVRTVADAGETCESLLKSVCKEMKYAYSFNELGQLYLVPLSTETIPTTSTIYDNSLYDSINLSRRARTYRGSRIKWTELGTSNGVLVYRDITNQSTTHPDCWIEVSNGSHYPSPDGADSYIKACDIMNGADVFSISNVSPSVEFMPPNCGTYSISGHGADSLSVLVNGTGTGHISKLQATADMTYIKSNNVTYGDGDQVTDSLHEEDCRWIHDKVSAQKYANFIAQYDKYCSSEFTFSTKQSFSLGEIIVLNENLHTGLRNTLMITRRTRTLVDYDAVNKVFTGTWSYRAVSTDAFDYTKTTSEESTSIPSSSSYTQPQADLSSVSGIQLSTDKSFLVKDLRSSIVQTMHIYAHIIGGLTGITVTASYSDGQSIAVTQVTADEEWTITVPEAKDAQGVNITASIGSENYNTIYVSYNDHTQYYKFLGNYSSNPTEAQAGSVILKNDFYVNTTDGKTYECTNRTETQSVPTFTWSEMSLNADNANKFLTALESATQAGIALESMSNPNTVSWFNTIIAAKAVIDNLFSRYITVLNGGSIHSDFYNGDGTVNPSSTATQGFYLGGDTGELKCYSGEMTGLKATNVTIDGNSTFKGDFDCDVIKTDVGASTPVQFNTQYNDYRQAHWLSIALQNYGLLRGQQNPGPMYSCSISGVSGIAYIAIREGQSDPVSTSSFATELYFYDSAKNQVDIKQYLSCSSVGISGTTLRSSTVSGGNYGIWATSGFTLYINTADQTLTLNVPGWDNHSILSNDNVWVSDQWLVVEESGAIRSYATKPSLSSYYKTLLPPGVLMLKNTTV